MVIYIAECVLGVFAYDEEGKLVSSKQFPRDIAKIAGRLASVQMGMPTEEHRELISELIDEGHLEFCVESSELATQLQKEFKRVEFEAQMPNKAGVILRASLRKLARKFGVGDINELIRNVNLLLTRDRLRKEVAERDKLIIQAIDMLDELDKTANIICGRIREWYSLHFPELNKLVPEHRTYLELVLKLGARENFTAQAVKEATKISDDEAERIAQAAMNSLGAPFDELDMQAIRDCAKEVFSMYEIRERIAEYIDGLMAQVAPNIRAVVGSSIGARLISLAGGLNELARMPSSTLQVLGAEKALFRALRTKGKPPKHGVIYQYPDVRGVPKWQRGKIARALAGKLTIAARVDAMSGEFIGDKLSADLRARIADIKAKHEKP